jgi:hypothetical protein
MLAAIMYVALLFHPHGNDCPPGYLKICNKDFPDICICMQVIRQG